MLVWPTAGPHGLPAGDDGRHGPAAKLEQLPLVAAVRRPHAPDVEAEGEQMPLHATSLLLKFST